LAQKPLLQAHRVLWHVLSAGTGNSGAKDVIGKLTSLICKLDQSAANQFGES
jgi:hypothetical protein